MRAATATGDLGKGKITSGKIYFFVGIRALREVGWASPEKARPGNPAEQQAWAGQVAGFREPGPGFGAHAWRYGTAVALNMGVRLRETAGGCKVSLDNRPEGSHPSIEHIQTEGRVRKRAGVQ